MDSLKDNPIVLLLMAAAALGIGFWVVKWVLIYGWIALKKILKVVFTFFLPFDFSEDL